MDVENLTGNTYFLGRVEYRLVPGGTVNDHLAVYFQVKVSAGTGTYSYLAASYRWVAAAA